MKKVLFLLCFIIVLTFPSMAFAEVLSNSSYTVWIRAAADQKWRAQYGTNWKSECNYELEEADNVFISKFGINFFTGAYSAYTSPTSNSASYQLTALRSRVPTNGCDIVYGFSLNYNVGPAGIAEFNGRYAMNFYALIPAIRHEMSHIYGADDHHDYTVQCIMTNLSRYPSTWCPTCMSVIKRNASRW